ncbi:MAG: hypothetical protein PHE83_18815, partial [Opitutaceae bacterium]|nr:hypothetical protein [Opitutaceae bacterium]
VERGDVEAAATALDKVNLLIAFNLGGHGHETPAPNTVRFPVEALIPRTLQGVCLVNGHAKLRVFDQFAG